MNIIRCLRCERNIDLDEESAYCLEEISEDIYENDWDMVCDNCTTEKEIEYLERGEKE